MNPNPASEDVSKLGGAGGATGNEPIYVSDETAGTPLTSHSVDNDIETLGSFEQTTKSQPSPKPSPKPNPKPNPKRGIFSENVKQTIRQFLGNFLGKIKGGGKSPPHVSLVSTVLSGLFSFIGIFSVSFISHHGGAETLVIASFGGECVRLLLWKG